MWDVAILIGVESDVGIFKKCRKLCEIIIKSLQSDVT